MPDQIVLSGGRRIGAPAPTFVIAEAGVNHNGRLDMALELIDLAADAGVDAVKFQTFSADRLVSPHAPLAEYQVQNFPDARTQLDMLRNLELPRADYASLLARCRARGIMFLSTPFEEGSADFLESLDVPAFKISSGEVTNLPFLRHVAGKGRPILLSTGMANLIEVGAAVDTIRAAGNGALALFHCTSDYPAAPADCNLRAMSTMRDSFGCPVGYSDHTLGNEIAVAAVALGAELIERHITLDKALPGPDHRASLDPAELKAMMDCIRNVESAIGHGRKEPSATERNTAEVARKSLHTIDDMKAGSVIAVGSITTRRPGTGISPAQMDKVIGHRVARDIPAGTMLTWDDLT